MHTCGHVHLWACTQVSAVLNSDVVDPLRALVFHRKLEFTKTEKAKPLSFGLPQMAAAKMQTGKTQHSDGGYH